MVEKQQLSQAAYDRLKEEHTKLTTAGRIDIAKKIEVARELGDLKENGDYHAAKEEQGKMEGRIAHLAAMLENSHIIESSDASQVEHGSIVTITYEGDDTPEKYLVGSIEERHDDLDVISPGSPMGAALIGAKVGETVGYEAPGGTLRVTIQEIT